MAELARANVSVTNLAKMLNTSRQNLYNKLTGQYNITLIDALAIKKALQHCSIDLPLEYLFGGDYEEK